MNIEEVIKLEADNATHIYLLKEGFFWRTYDRSAYRFVKHIRSFQVIKRHIKKVNQEVCYIGFPENMLESVLKLYGKENLAIIEKTKSQVSIQITKTEENEETAFLEWKTNIVVPAAKDEKWLSRKIKEYPVFTKTPLETVQFVAEIQERLNINSDVSIEI